MVLFSIVLPTRNRAALLAETLRTVRQQEFTDFEVIIIDDGSTDDTLAVVGRIMPEALVLSSRHHHPAATRNVGIAAASGKYLAFLDSDDLWFPWTLATYARAIEAHQPSVLIGHPKWFSLQPPTVRAAGLRATTGADLLSLHAACGCGFPGATLVLRTDDVRSAGGFADTRSGYSDIDLALRLGVAPMAVYIDSPCTVVCRNHDGNFTRRADLVVAGVRFLGERERAGVYPGGASRRPERRRCIAACFRHASRSLNDVGEPRAALEAWASGLSLQATRAGARHALGFPLRVAARVAGARLR